MTNNRKYIVNLVFSISTNRWCKWLSKVAAEQRRWLLSSFCDVWQIAQKPCKNSFTFFCWSRRERHSNYPEGEGIKIKYQVLWTEEKNLNGAKELCDRRKRALPLPGVKTKKKKTAASGLLHRIWCKDTMIPCSKQPEKARTGSVNCNVHECWTVSAPFFSSVCSQQVNKQNLIGTTVFSQRSATQRNLFY